MKILNKFKNNQYTQTVYIALICFFTYACIYAFRKPFTVGIYENMPSYFGIGFKNLLVIAQVLGYTASKMFGIKFISELKNKGRGKLILLLIIFSWIPLLLFPIVPAPIGILCLFLNGFPLGITWGIIFSFVEGRKTTDFIGAALAVSFIVSSGVVKSVGKWLHVSIGIAEMWVPFYTGLLFIFPLILLIFALEKIPAPTSKEIDLKSARLPMSSNERKQFFINFMPGLFAFIFIYVILTLFRDLRDNFAADIWTNLGYANNASVFTNTELPIALMVLLLIASMILIKNNKAVFLISQYIILAGFLIVAVSTFLFQQHYINGFYWMLLVGLGLYMGYIPFNSILFDRMIATFRLKGNVGYLMYLMDSFGYLASVMVILIKGAAHIQLNWAEFYAKGVYLFSIIGFIMTTFSLIYYTNKIKKVNA
jgi:hypothetical protein